ncbi:MAG: hypothetical protein U5K79_23230 [Cyclobacteriaceae bacterium]|nr:hypothetical protein [Cyclobacteriaceae bacterium]
MPGKEMTQFALELGYDLKYKLGSSESGLYQVDLPPGQYTIVTVENSAASNFCLSEPVVVTIGLDVPDPTITTNTVADYTCNANGTGSVSTHLQPVADSDLVNFTYEWYTRRQIHLSACWLRKQGIYQLTCLSGNYSVKVIDTNGPEQWLSVQENNQLTQNPNQQDYNSRKRQQRILRAYMLTAPHI